MPAGRKITPTKILMGKEGNQLVRLEIPLKNRSLALRDEMFPPKFLQPPINGFLGMVIEVGLQSLCKQKGLSFDKLIYTPPAKPAKEPPPAPGAKVLPVHREVVRRLGKGESPHAINKDLHSRPAGKKPAAKKKPASTPKAKKVKSKRVRPKRKR